MPLSEGQIAWVTGGTSGIGLEIAKALIAKGVRVAVTGRDQSKLDRTASELGVLALRCDMSNEREVKEAHAAVVLQLGPVDILINNAGISPFTKFSETTVEEFDQVIDINLTGYFLAAREVLLSMYERKQGAIVQLLSIASIKAFAGGAAYIASKFGALGLTNSLREEARKHNVKVIAVLPGATETPLWGVEEREEFHERMMQPEDIAITVVQLLEQPDRMLTEEIVLRPIGGDL
jgi:3-oxoacyl-[acyl-carrier protein] reductase